MPHEPYAAPEGPSPAAAAGEPAVGPLFEHAGLALALLDPGARVTAANGAFHRQLGVAGPLVGRPLAELLGLPPSLLAPVETIAAGRRAQHRIEARVVTPGRGQRWGSLTLSGVAGRPAVLALLEDVSERHRFEEEQMELRVALGKAASEWRATFDAIDMPILILTDEGRVARLNRSARDLSALPFREVLGRRLEELGEDELWQQAGSVAGRVRETGRPDQVEVWQEDSDRTWVISSSPSRPDLSSERSTILTIKELTGMVRLQESLRRTETMAAMGSLLAGVAHEVRNPLFGISAVVDALERRIEGHQELGRHLGYLRRELGRLEKLMADLLDFGRPVTLEAEPLSFEEVVEEALEACKARLVSAGVRLARRQAGAAMPVLADRQRAVQAIVNVLENAVHFSPAGGVLEVTTERTGEGAEGWCVLRVRDSGPGFPPDDLERVFDPFFSRRKGGTGLGLPIVARVLDLHRGRATVGNDPAGGAVVVLRFPLRHAGGEADADATFDFRNAPRAATVEAPSERPGVRPPAEQSQEEEN